MVNLKLIYYRYYNSEKAKEIPESKIPFYDMTVVFGGSLYYEINGEKVTVNENECIFIPPDSSRKRYGGNAPSEYASFNFTTDEALKLPLVVKNCSGSEIRHIVFACNRFKNPYELKALGVMQPLAAALIGALVFAESRGKYSEITSGILSFVQKNYSLNLSLGEICNEIGYSPTYAESVFKKDTGRSVIDCLIETRISKAKELLIENIAPVTEIAEKTGFNDYNYFSRLFKKRTGFSPLRFRQKFNIKT